ncbi:hypothetical protein LP419_18290 [Massilia sp. H-1]|nr:hypothetical protein LP419_18290 [Massilia sp. H-1]
MSSSTLRPDRQGQGRSRVQREKREQPGGAAKPARAGRCRDRRIQRQGADRAR